jgi:hypothetical protein
MVAGGDGKGEVAQELAGQQRGHQEPGVHTAAISGNPTGGRADDGTNQYHQHQRGTGGQSAAGNGVSCR